MLQDKLLGMLARYAERHPDEDARRFRRFVAAQPRCFERDCFADGHVTGSAALLSRDGSRLLLTHHAKLGRWLQLGGHADGDPDPLRVACREAEEESGLRVVPLAAEPLDVDIHAIPALGGEPSHLHYDVRFALTLAAADEAHRRSPESLALRWVPLADIAAVTSEASVLRLAAKCRRAFPGGAAASAARRRPSVE